jgi:hypothetical protein
VKKHQPQDPHSRAFQVLFNADSVRMAGLLEPEKSKRVPPHQNSLCLKCHAVAGATNEQVTAEGVGCAACHGSSENWLTMHYLPSWKAMSNREKADCGFIPTKNLVARISNCATCHVGGADREVNHDLIAAGHPRLAFEYTRFHFEPTYQKHWSEKLEPADFESRAWVIGQVASLRAAVEVLRGRAERAAARDPHTPWPEFSEGSCYACHQNVARNPFPDQPGTTPLRGVQGGRQRRSGAIPWQTWYSSLGDTHDILAGGGPIVDLAALRTEMQRRMPDPHKVMEHSEKVLAALEDRLARWQAAEDNGTIPQFTPERARDLGQELAAGALTEACELRDYDWDFVAQRYLGLAAIYHASGGASEIAGWRPPLDRLRKALAFTAAGGGQFNSPPDYQPRAAACPLVELRTITTSRSSR